MLGMVLTRLAARESHVVEATQSISVWRPERQTPHNQSRYPRSHSRKPGKVLVGTVAEADLLVSWNFRHIVRFDKIRLFNSVHLEYGYKELHIHSPERWRFMNAQTIDTMALVRQIRDNHSQCLQGKTHEERIAFYREQARRMQDKTAALLADKTSAPSQKAQTPAVGR
jgi:hypothetical protein